MNDDLLNDPELNPPGRHDFRRVGKGTPMVLDPETGKMVRRRRSSSAGKVLDDESNLTDWKLRTVLVGAAQLPEVLAMVSVLDPESDKKAIRDHVEECLQAGKGNSRKVQGTAVHAMFDHVDLQHDWLPAPQFRAVVNAYLAMLDYFGLVAIDVEAQCVNDRWGLAGTMDRRYRTTRALVAPDGSVIPIGSVLVGDTKTGLSLEYAAGTYATQLAAYVDSVRYDVLTDERSPFDPPNYPDWALVVHALPERDSCELYWVDITQGRAGLALAHQVWEWRRGTGLLTAAIPPLRAVPDVPQEPQEPSEPPQGTSEPREPAGLSESLPEIEESRLLPEVKEWLRARVLVIMNHSDLAKQQLARRWPEGVPGLKADGHTMEQLDMLAAAIDQVEADWSIPFGPSDPRVLASQARHPSAVQDDAEMALLSKAVHEHPRTHLLRAWSLAAVKGTVGAPVQNRYPIAYALLDFASLPVEHWSDDDVTEVLVGTLNAMGYPGGLADLVYLKPEDAPTILSAAFAIATGNAMLMYDADDKPVVRFNVRQSDG